MTFLLVRTMKDRRWYDVSVPWLPGSIRAVTLWPWCLYRGKVIEEPCLRLHEHYHRAQATRWLVMPWYVAYLVLEIARRITFTPADKHPMEVEAYRLQAECEAQGR